MTLSTAREHPGAASEEPRGPDATRAALSGGLALIDRADLLHLAWREALAERGERLQRVLAAALKEHRTQRALLDEGMPPPSGPEEALARTRRYRAGVHTGVLARFRDAVPGEKLYSGGATALPELLDALAALADELPEEFILPDLDEDWVAREDDRRMLRLRKLGTRARRRLARTRERLAARAVGLIRGRRAARRRAYERRVEPRRVFLDEVAAGLGEEWLEESRIVTLALASRVAAADDALTLWTSEIIAAERALDRRMWAPDAAGPTVGDLAGVRAAAETLEHALEALAEPELPAALPAREGGGVRAAFADSVRDGGTYRHLRKAGPGFEGARRRAAKAAAHAIRWEEGVDGSRVLDESLLGVRKRLGHSVARAAGEARECGCIQATGAMQTLEVRLQRAEVRVAKAETEALADIIEEEGATLTREYQRVFAGASPAGEALTAGAAVLDEERMELAETLPVEVRIPTRRPGEVRLDDPTRIVALREIAVQSFSLALAPRVAVDAESLRGAIARGWTEAAQGEQVVDYNQQAALEEALEGGAEADERARQLFLDGIRRASARLADGRARMEERYESYCAAIFRVVDGDWQDFHSAVDSATSLEAGLEQLRARFRRWSRRTLQSGAATLASRFADLRKLSRRVRTRTRLAVRRGQSAIGVSESSAVERQRTVDVLAGAAAVRSELPIIYRRLFSVAAVADPAFLVGRAAERGIVREHIERWEEGRRGTGGLVVTGGPGAGRTSLLNVIASELDIPSVRIDLGARIETEEEISSILCEALKLASAGSLDEVEARLTGSDGMTRVVCLLDGLEHLVLRVPGGRTLIDRLLVLFSRTGLSVCWVATCTSLSWRYVRRTSASSANLMREVPLTVLQASDLEKAILLRHRRTGILLRFSEPKEMSPLLRQRLRKARREEDRQALLSAEYFERLYRHSGRNVPLAYHYWLRSTDFGSEPGTLVIKPVAPLSWAFLGDLDLSSSFSLHALMMHSALDSETHARALRMPQPQSVLILQRFLDMHLIERVEEAAAYRLNPLALHAVAEHLRARRILY